MKKRYVLLFGTRPEAVKLRSVYQEMKKADLGEIRCVFSGQHPETCAEGMPIDKNLRTASEGKTLAETAGSLIAAIGKELCRTRPDWLIVQGDTATAYAGAMAGFLCGVKTAHVEAGLRTGDFGQPFPEEFFRRQIALAANLHFAPTETAVENLLKEGVKKEDVFLVGNTGIDALLALPETAHKKRKKPEQPLVLFTVHRRENTGERLTGILGAVKIIAEKHPEMQIRFPVHPNPILSERIRELDGIPNIKKSPPLGYADFIRQMSECSLILTDSGGVEEEAATLGIPTVVLRQKTEREEGIHTGTLCLASGTAERIAKAAETMLKKGRVQPSFPFGDGHAARRIVKILKERSNG